MTTIDLECPHCGRVGSVPRDRAHSRLVCRKCNQVFHMNAMGKAVMGEPPHPVAGHGHAHDHHHAPAPTPRPHARDDDEGPPSLPLKPIGVGLLVCLLAFLGYRGLPSAESSLDSLSARAKTLVDAVVHDDMGVVRENAMPDSASDAEQFVKQMLAPKVVELKKHSAAQEVVANVLVLDVNQEKQVAQVLAIFAPAKGSTRDEAIHEAAGDLAAGKSTSEFNLYFRKDPSGRWRLDGKKTLYPKTNT